jgi:serine/threonine-protein kinase SRPK3
MTIRYAQYPSVELLNVYRPGGFHPVHLNDTFENGRYTVLHKLGYGAYSTVWLVKDHSSGKYASLKIFAADALIWSQAGNSPVSSDDETKVLLHLQSELINDEGKDYVIRLLNYFEHKGPNGVHRCIVTEVLGPNLNADLEDLYPTEILPPEVARRFAHQVGLGLKFLQNRGVVHGGKSNFEVLSLVTHDACRSSPR